ncbi:MAG: RagB/SusD family nutrient uptake outer membrane protein [Chitinophagaceae bacterium]|nr:RagB/SusD family nutrient uptake outer membrane protein [Chitinophagaceae bacterium]
MKRNNLLIYILAATMVIPGGCRKFLKERSQDEMTPQTVASLNELLAREGYPFVGSSSTATDGFSFCNFLNFLDDDCHMQNRDLTYVQPYARPFYTWSDNPYEEIINLTYGLQTSRNPYQQLYNRIRGCNVVLDMLNDVSGPQDQKEQIEGEALTLRAYYYFMLANLYGRPYNDPVNKNNVSPAVPIVRSGGIAEKPLARNTVKEVYDLMESDIGQAISLLEKNKKLSSVYRINYRSAWLLASRIYLHMEQWDKVLGYTNKLIGDYPQLTDLNTWKTPSTQSISSPANTPFIASTNVETLFLFSGSRGGDMQVFYQPPVTPVMLASNELTDLYETNDMRYTPFVSNPSPNFYLTRTSGYYTASKVNRLSEGGRCFRMSEAYVNRAEAIIRKAMAGEGNASLQAALDDLNLLRTKRFKAGSSNTMVTLASLDNDPVKVFEFYKQERRREFCFEEFRWFDLRRYGQPEIVHTFDPNEPVVTNPSLPVETYTLPQGGNRYVMKFPPTALEANPLLTQNP